MLNNRPYLRMMLVLVALIAVAAMIVNATQVKYVLLWTDALVYVLVVAIAAFAIRTRQREHLRAPWRHVLRRKIAMCALVVLVAYVVIGLLDSVHFRLPLKVQSGETEVFHAGEVLSLFDLTVTPLRERVEKTYSAPFSSHAYVKENIETPTGQIRDYAPLQYGGQHLYDPQQDRVPNITLSLFIAFALTVLVCIVISMSLAFWVARRNRKQYGEVFDSIIRGETDAPFREMLLTFAVMCFLVLAAVWLAPNYHIFGTDKVGQDVFYLSLKSIRTGLVIGTLTTLIMLPFAIALGIMAGHMRGWVDDVVQYIYTTLNSIPGVLLIAAAVLSLDVFMTNHPEMFDTVTERADLRLLFLCMILGITSWTGLCRLLCGETLKLSSMDYIEASTSFGVGHFKIMLKHILPNVMHIVLITIVLDFSGLVLAEAVLAYVGVGVDPTTISWGNMINSARLELARDPVVWWSLVAAFIFMFVLVLAANLFSDAVRDAFDPRVSQVGK